MATDDLNKALEYLLLAKSSFREVNKSESVNMIIWIEREIKELIEKAWQEK